MRKKVSFSDKNQIQLIPHLIEFKNVGLDKLLWYSQEDIKKRRKEHLEKLLEYFKSKTTIE